MTQDQAVLEFCTVTKWHKYQTAAVLRASLSVYPKEKVLIRGDGGVRDLFRMASGLEKPDEGEIRMNKKAAVIPESFPYLEGMTVWDYIQLPQLLRGAGVFEAKGRARPWLERCGLSDKCSMRAKTMTGLDKARLLLAAAFADEPDIILMAGTILDLSQKDREQFWETAQTLTAQSGAAFLCFSYRKTEQMSFDKVYEIEDGRLDRRQIQ